MTVPSDVSYSVDLRAIRPEHVRAHPTQRLLIVTMPDPEVEDVTPLLSDLKAENTFKGARFRRLDADASREIQNALLREDYQARAAKEARDRIPEVRERARGALQRLGHRPDARAERVAPEEWPRLVEEIGLDVVGELKPR
jgi:hypothetical protein